jgi:hypothetical protein
LEFSVVVPYYLTISWRIFARYIKISISFVDFDGKVDLKNPNCCSPLNRRRQERLPVQIAKTKFKSKSDSQWNKQF